MGASNMVDSQPSGRNFWGRLEKPRIPEKSYLGCSQSKHLKGRGRWISVVWSWSTRWILSQPRLHSEMREVCGHWMDLTNSVLSWMLSWAVSQLVSTTLALLVMKADRQWAAGAATLYLLLSENCTELSCFLVGKAEAASASMPSGKFITKVSH